LAHHLHLCAVAVELAAQLADLSGRAIGAHYGICAHGVVANRRRLATRPEVLQLIETLGRRLRKLRTKVVSSGLTPTDVDGIFAPGTTDR